MKKTFHGNVKQKAGEGPGRHKPRPSGYKTHKTAVVIS